jgi:hypothetical protein
MQTGTSREKIFKEVDKTKQLIVMKRTCLQRRTNTDESAGWQTCEFPARWSGGHRVKKYNEGKNYNR